MKKFLLLGIIFIATITHTLAQTKPKNKQVYNLFQKAIYLANKDDTIEAIKICQKIKKKDPNFTETYILEAQIHQTNKNYAKAIELYKKVIEIAPNYAEVYYFIAQNYHKISKYKESNYYLSKFMEKPTTNEKIQESEKLFKINNFRLEQLQNPLPIKLYKLPEYINTTSDEYFPTLNHTNDALLFTRKNQNDENIFITYFKGEWDKPVSISPYINTPFNNEGGQCLNADGTILYFTRCIPGSGCDLYYCQKDKSGYWLPPEPLSEINSRYWEAQPTISSEGKYLFFASNRPGGYGKMDIWCSIFKNGRWSTPFNLGPKINTSENEMKPFLYSDNKTLFFISDGHIGMGKFDVFMSTWLSDTTFSEPINLGYPINNNFDQLGFTIDSHGKIAYIASFDTISQSFDLYFFYMPEKYQIQENYYLRIWIHDQLTGLPIEADKISIINLNTKDTLINLIQKNYLVAVLPKSNEFCLNIFKQNYSFYSQNIYFGNDSNDKNLEIYLEPITKNQIITLNNIYYETNSYKLDEKSKIELNNLVEFLKINPTIKIQINGHTDSVGSFKYNMELSEKRAREVANYIIKEGIEANRITYKGFGYTKPIAENQNENTKKLNRRTEILILEK